MPDMTIKREHNDDDSTRVKRVKVESNGDGKMDVASNPYLAHWNDEKPAVKSEYGGDGGDALAHFQRHATTSKQAKAAEDGPNNPFTGRPLSSNYMSILKKRRDLPVHQQRYSTTHALHCNYMPDCS
jgi:pre-mRNA-splicing factor ATP-dependent RNA helicase DHX15/PRP43